MMNGETQMEEKLLSLITFGNKLSLSENYELARAIYPHRYHDGQSIWQWLPGYQDGFQGLYEDDMILIEMPDNEPSRYHWEYAINTKTGWRWAFDPEELEALLIENGYRTKKVEQQVREAAAWREIEEARAKQR